MGGSFYPTVACIPIQVQGASAIPTKYATYHFMLLMQIQRLLLLIQEFICARDAIGLEKACLVQMHSKGKPSNTCLGTDIKLLLH